jgi:hypothetical protein
VIESHRDRQRDGGQGVPGERAIGKRIFARTGGPEPEPFEVIGVVRHQRSSSLAADGRETMYVPDGQFGFGNVFNWVIRTSGDPSSLTPAARAAIKEINPRFRHHQPARRTMI